MTDADLNAYRQAHSQSYFSKAADWAGDHMSEIGHGALDIIGLIPVVGEVADGINAAWYLAEGDYTNAALSAAAMIPFAGWAATGAKTALKGADALKGLDEGADALRLVGARGGAGPVSQGTAGVERTVADIEASGGRVLGREVTVEVNGVRTRPDLYAQLPNGKPAFVEVKTGEGARLTPNQAAGFPGIEAGGAVPRGANAANAGLEPGTALPPTPVWVVHQPWPLP
jgi:hypothetical protein